MACCLFDTNCLNQWCLIENCTLRNNLRWNLNKKLNLLCIYNAIYIMQYNAFGKSSVKYWLFCLRFNLLTPGNIISSNPFPHYMDFCADNPLEAYFLPVKLGVSPWQTLLGLLSWQPVFKANHFYTFEDWVCVDFINERLLWSSTKPLPDLILTISYDAICHHLRQMYPSIYKSFHLPSGTNALIMSFMEL